MSTCRAIGTLTRLTFISQLLNSCRVWAERFCRPFANISLTSYQWGKSVQKCTNIVKIKSWLSSMLMAIFTVNYHWKTCGESSPFTKFGIIEASVSVAQVCWAMRVAGVSASHWSPALRPGLWLVNWRTQTIARSRLRWGDLAWLRGQLRWDGRVVSTDH